MEILYNLIGLLVIWVYTFVKSPQYMHLRPVHFTTCKFFNLKIFFKRMICHFRYHPNECRLIEQTKQRWPQKNTFIYHATLQVYKLHKVKGTQMLYFYKALFTLLWEGCWRFLAKPLRLGWGSGDDQSQALLLKSLSTSQRGGKTGSPV